jgi:endoglucanase
MLPRKNIVLVFLLALLIVGGCSLLGISSGPKSVVELYGLIHTKGNQVVDQNENPVALHGMSMFWSQFKDGGKFYNEKCIQWLYNDFNCTIVRAAMGIDGGGYIANPKLEVEKISKVIDECIKLGIYVIIDWHDHRAEKHTDKAVEFFGMMAQKYGDKPNIIYEIYNEPIKVSWSEVVKPYSETVIKEIRKYDSDNLILVGNPTWSQDVDVAAKDPIKDINVAYIIHFYTSTHKHVLRDKCEAALNSGIALFVSEFGISEASGNGTIDWEATKQWFDFVKKYNLSTCNWSVSDKKETSASLMPGANAEGDWKESDLSESGKWNRNYIRTENKEVFKIINFSNAQ